MDLIYTVLFYGGIFLIWYCRKKRRNDDEPQEPDTVARLEHEVLEPRERRLWGHGMECTYCHGPYVPNATHSTMRQVKRT